MRPAPSPTPMPPLATKMNPPFVLNKPDMPVWQSLRTKSAWVGGVGVGECGPSPCPRPSPAHEGPLSLPLAPGPDSHPQCLAWPVEGRRGIASMGHQSPPVTAARGPKSLDLAPQLGGGGLWCLHPWASVMLASTTNPHLCLSSLAVIMRLSCAGARLLAASHLPGLVVVGPLPCPLGYSHVLQCLAFGRPALCSGVPHGCGMWMSCMCT